MVVPDDDHRDRGRRAPTTAAATRPTVAAARYLSWDWDPEPDDTLVATEYAFVLRAADGTVDGVHETHRNGLFPRRRGCACSPPPASTPDAALERTDRRPPRPRTFFLGHRPAEGRNGRPDRSGSRRQDGSNQVSPPRTRSASAGPHESRKYGWIGPGSSSAGWTTRHVRSTTS